ncbi:hypothetical protein GOV09_00025 [Candidatus Woesearchaeota archaeon]|nr:hypothetical protein [Candidatus Woesearchaeota archaeon]
MNFFYPLAYDELATLARQIEASSSRIANSLKEKYNTKNNERSALVDSYNSLLEKQKALT